MSDRTDASAASDPTDAWLAAMTLDEQVSLLSGADFWTTVALPRLGVSAVKVSDGPNGARGGVFKDGPATACFPAAIALGSSWDPALVEQAGAALGRETRQKGAHALLAPTVNLQRTLFNGRNFECYSEDPWLSAELAVAYVRGVQSQGVAATIKHFVANDSEYQRMTISSDVSERALRELYLLPFERAVKEAGVLAVMSAYNRINGVFAADHQPLLQHVLRDEWGFDGLVMSDWSAHLDTVASVLAGCDLEMPGPARQRGAGLRAAVDDGRLSADAVRACARRVLQFVVRSGAKQGDARAAERADDLPEHRALIRTLGAAGAVLLKNDAPHGAAGADALLPLAPRPGQTIALIGRAARVPQIMGGGSAVVNAHYRIAPYDALAARLPGVTLTHHDGADIHRWVPVLAQPMALEYFASADCSGAVVHRESTVNSERMWFDSLPPGLNRACFSVRARLRFVAESAGEHQFSLISAGRSRASVDGEPLLDAWQHWQPGQPYFGNGCDEVLASRRLNAGQVCDIVVDFSSQSEPQQLVHALRLGVARRLDASDIAAAVDAARRADFALVFAGLNGEWDAEGMDRSSLALPHLQDELIARVAAANPRTVVVLQTGSPVALPWLDAVPALLQAWYPGQECGNAIADVLLGDAEPGGRLAQTWPLRLADGVAAGDARAYPGVDGHVRYDEGVFIGYRHYQRHAKPVQFAFGHGLSYTRFALSALRLDRDSLAPGDSLGVQVTLRNAGARAGSEVLQVYVAPPAGRLPRPPHELKAFAKRGLAAGASAEVAFTLPMRAFACFDDSRQAWVAEAGRYQVAVGRSSSALDLSVSVELLADWVLPVAAAAVPLG